MLPHLPLGLPPAVVTLFEVVDASRVDGPVVALAIGSPASLDEAVVERQIVADRISPAGATVTKVGKVVEDVLVDISKDLNY